MNRNKPFFCLVHFQKVFLESASGSGKVYVPFISGPTVMNNRSLMYIIFPFRTVAKTLKSARETQRACVLRPAICFGHGQQLCKPHRRVQRPSSKDQKGQTLRHSTISVLRGRPPPASRQHKDSKNTIAQPVSKYQLHLATQWLFKESCLQQV